MQVDRISTALTRIETAALRLTEVARSGCTLAEEESDTRYQALRQEASSALAELDLLIARLDR